MPPSKHTIGSLELRRLKENCPLLPSRSIWPKHFKQNSRLLGKHVFTLWTIHLTSAKEAADIKAVQRRSSPTKQGCKVFFNYMKKLGTDTIVA